MCDGDLAAVTPVNESCSPEWKEIYTNTFVQGQYAVHLSARTLQQCQYACVFNPRCVAILFPGCYLYSNLLDTRRFQWGFNVYELVKRCNITAGLLFIDNYF